MKTKNEGTSVVKELLRVGVHVLTLFERVKGWKAERAKLRVIDGEGDREV